MFQDNGIYTFKAVDKCYKLLATKNVRMSNFIKLSWNYVLYVFVNTWHYHFLIAYLIFFKSKL